MDSLKDKMDLIQREISMPIKQEILIKRMPRVFLHHIKGCLDGDLSNIQSQLMNKMTPL